MKKTKSNDLSFVSFMKYQIDILKDTKRFGTANNYENTLSRFRKFLGDENEDVSLKSIDSTLIERYNDYLVGNGLSRNSISFYMRVLRAVYNKAVRQNIIKPKECFKNVYTGIDKTVKRALDETLITEIYNIDLTSDSDMMLARDVFVFSYLTRGMAFVDIAFLTKKSLQGDRIRYKRRKTGQMLDIKIEPCIHAIISKYNNPESRYVFPFITSENADESYRQYKNAINKYNIQLKKISGLLSCDVGLTSYVSRHSWATSARRHNVPVSVISAGLGHTNESATLIYLASIDNALIDNANKEIITSITKDFYERNL